MGKWSVLVVRKSVAYSEWPTKYSLKGLRNAEDGMYVSEAQEAALTQATWKQSHKGQPLRREYSELRFVPRLVPTSWG